VTGPFQQQPDGRLHGTVIVHNQDFRHRTFPRSESGLTSTTGCNVSLNLDSHASI
jgi:hypothetical protein